MRTVELLSPAKTADIGIEAIRHGADAVYIGAPQFGARQAAGNSIEDIDRLVQFAHYFRAKVYVTVNTILKDSELHEAEMMIRQLYDIGVDALIVQDMGLLKMDLPPIPLHASTQMDNRSVDKVQFLEKAGFEQVVLARELSSREIGEIHAACPDVKLEVFVHGALCVSYSGQCYVSEACFGRSANRGECAQVCRMEYDLEDADGTVILKQKHLLSLKDLCQLDNLKEIIDAGATSLKIEGRLKDMTYVKNVTAAYSRALDALVKAFPDKYARASSGRVSLMFEPDVTKSFNRGFTDYFLHGRNDKIFSFDTPKALGEYVGTVKDMYTNCFTVAGVKSFANGDGLCFLDSRGKLYGFRVNKVENGRLYPLEMPRRLRPKMQLYRNYDHTFEQHLLRNSAERTIPVDIDIYDMETGFRLTMTDDDGCAASLVVECVKELARSHQSENVQRQLSKLGGTLLSARSVNIRYKKNWFIPSSLLSEWRRELVKMMEEERRRYCPRYEQVFTPTHHPYIASTRLTYLGNVMNTAARSFYQDHGVTTVDWAYERQKQDGVPLMYCRHCIQYSMGWCPSRQHKVTPYRRPLYLRLANGTRFRLDFDCKNCMMRVYLDRN